MHPEADNGMIHISSKYSFAETFQRANSKIREKGLTIFCIIDHSGEAEKVGLRMHPSRVIIFGNPHSGTPVMVASPTLAIDLPLKALIWEDAGGKVWASYNSPEYLKQRHHIPGDLLASISGTGSILSAALE